MRAQNTIEIGSEGKSENDTGLTRKLKVDSSAPEIQCALKFAQNGSQATKL